MRDPEKFYYTKQKLIDLWLAKWPEDKNNPDLERMAIAGYVETKRGFIWYAYYGMEGTQ